MVAMIRKLFTYLVYFFAFVGFALTIGYFGVNFGLTNTTGIIDNQRQSFLAGVLPAVINIKTKSTPLWANTEEWNILEEAVRRDKDIINKAGMDSGVSPRLIAANLITEQLRLFFTEREFYKQFFFPLKILGSQTQFSWGVMGMKEETAIQVENNLKDPTSPFYIGSQYEHLLDFQTSDIKTERYVRMTDQHNHYWSYLYAGLYLKEVQTQWQKTGFSIGDKPEILSTLYNIGFDNSKPNPYPSTGGAQIQLGTQSYSFGGLAGEFYFSNIMTDIFPR
jgi:hypothetical protein